MSRHLIIGALAWSALAGAAIAADRSMTVGVDQTKCINVRKAIDRHDVDVDEEGIVAARFDTNSNRLCVEGKKRGSATVEFSGTYRRLEAGRDLRETPRSFAHTVEVRVLPPPADVERVADRYDVKPGQSRRFQLGIFMTPPFSRRNEDRITWRLDRILLSTPDVVKVRRINEGPRVFLELSGVNKGEATVRLVGERKLRNDWQDVVRDVRVRVQ